MEPRPPAARSPAFWQSAYPMLTLAVLFWSGNFILGRAVSDLVPPIGLAFWRWAGALVLVLILARPFLRADLPALRRHWKMLLALSIFGVAAFNTFVYIGLHTTRAINALMLQSAIPVAIVLCSFLLFGERIGWAQAGGILLSLAGVAMIASRGEPAGLLLLSFNRGDAWVLAAVVSYALYSTLLRRRPAVHPLSFLAATFAVGALLLLPAAVWEHVAVQPMGITAASLLAIAYVAVFPGFLSYLFFNRGVELVGATRSGQFIHLMPVFGSLLAILLLGETFHPFHAAGIALIAGGIALASVGRRPTPPADGS